MLAFIEAIFQLRFPVFFSVCSSYVPMLFTAGNHCVWSVLPDVAFFKKKWLFLNPRGGKEDSLTEEISLQWKYYVTNFV